MTAYWKGKSLSEEHRKKLSEAHLGKVLSPEARAKISEANKGRPSPRKGQILSSETRGRMSKARVGHAVSSETRAKLRRAHLGRKCTAEQRARIGVAGKGRIPWNKGLLFPEKSGENHPNWRGGRTVIARGLRLTYEYRVWRKAVMDRDGWRCVLCGERANVADHILPFSSHVELRFDPKNGRAMCQPCHLKTPTYGNRKLKQANDALRLYGLLS